MLAVLIVWLFGDVSWHDCSECIYSDCCTKLLPLCFFYYLDLKEIGTEEVWESAVVSETRRVRTYETRFLSVWLLIKKTFEQSHSFRRRLLEQTDLLKVIFRCCVGCPLSIFFLSFYLCEGDREAELGLPFSPLCDRQTTLVAESQIGTSHKSHPLFLKPASSSLLSVVYAFVRFSINIHLRYIKQVKFIL